MQIPDLSGFNPPAAGSTPPFSSVPAAAWSLAACMLGAVDCLWLLPGCC